MKIAICFSGYPTLLKYTYKNLLAHFEASFDNFDIIAYLPECALAHKLERYFGKYLKAVEIKKDEILSEEGIGSSELKRGTRAYLQQIYGLKKVNEIRKAFESKNNITYDMLARCRFDIRFVSDIPKIDQLDLSSINIPAFQSHGGYNDRFAIGPRELMDIYFNIMETRYKSPEAIKGNAEEFLKYHLDLHRLKVNLVNVEFNRVRIFGIEKIDDTGRASSG